MYSANIATIEQVKDSKDTWNRLASKMAFPSIFCTWEWVYTWWQHFGKNYKPIILFIYKDEEIKGILPLASRLIIFRNGLVGRTLIYCGSQEVYPDHVDLIAENEDVESCIGAVSRFLASEYLEWDVLHLANVAEESQLLLWLKDDDCPLSHEISESSVSPFIAPAADMDEGKKSLGSRSKDYKRKGKILRERHGIEYMCCESSFNKQGLRTLFELHKKRAKQKRRVSTFRGPRIFDFHNAFQQRIDKNGWLWLRFLGNEDKIISAFYGFGYGKRVVYYQMGFDPEWERYSPGAVLLQEVIADAFSSGYSEFDFLRGGETYKSEWTEKSRKLVSANLFNKSVMGSFSQVAVHSKKLVKGYLKG